MTLSKVNIWCVELGWVFGVLVRADRSGTDRQTHIDTGTIISQAVYLSNLEDSWVKV